MYIAAASIGAHLCEMTSYLLHLGYTGDYPRAARRAAPAPAAALLLLIFDTVVWDSRNLVFSARFTAFVMPSTDQRQCREVERVKIYEDAFKFPSTVTWSSGRHALVCRDDVVRVRKYRRLGRWRLLTTSSALFQYTAQNAYERLRHEHYKSDFAVDVDGNGVSYTSTATITCRAEL
ncbi:hypothetical protein EVAR_70951_1 [Eumeta japonica]|uniref:Uncharacterized protein n=1 Tax=Eumeta variegata TaxID=151549 RepID=A0A4C2A106_EUMVA|nr:hypothetical protein EVAR_70951_1 [Eumeta japonica]